jgi:hypothetical protein
VNGPTTISKVIAFELGLMIAVLVWIAFAGIPGVKTHPVAEAEEPADGSFANVSSIYQPMPQSRQATQSHQPTHSRRRVAVAVPASAPVDYPADNVQLAQAPAQYSVAKVQTYDPGLTGQTYDDSVDASGQLSYGVDEPTGSGGVEGYIVNQDPANYIGTFPEPVLENPYDYYYGQPYGYAPPVQIVVLNNSRGFTHWNRGNHCRFPGNTMNAQRNPRVGPRSRGGQPVNGPAPVVRGPRAHLGPRMNTVNNNVAPRRIGSVQKARPAAAATSQPRRSP